MQTKILRVIAQGEPMYVQSKKSENGQLAKCYIRLKELGGECDVRQPGAVQVHPGQAGGGSPALPDTRVERSVLSGHRGERSEGGMKGSLSPGPSPAGRGGRASPPAPPLQGGEEPPPASIHL